MHVVWYLPAKRDLEAIRHYIGKDNPLAAKAVVARIFARTKELRRFPALGKPGRLDHTRELMVPGTSYFVAYEVIGDAIGIIRVVHGAQDWPDGV